MAEVNLQNFLDSLRPPIEAQLLAESVAPNDGEHIIEIGCGNGFVSLFLAANHPELGSITGIDIEPDNISAAQENLTLLKKSHKIKANVNFIHVDAREYSPNKRYDWLLCNPPFFSANASRPSPDQSRRNARQDQKLSLLDLFSCAHQFLYDDAKMAVVFPGFRKDELICVANNGGYAITRETHHPNIRKRNGGMWLVEFGRKFG